MKHGIETLTLEVTEILDNPGASDWLKDSLRTALHRDMVDAANDAEYLAGILRRRMLIVSERNQ